MRKRTSDKDKKNMADQPTELLPTGATIQPTLLHPETYPTVTVETDIVPPKLQLPRGYGKRFTNVRLLGQGGTGATYAALDAELERTVVLKVLHHAPEGVAPKDFARHEARTVSNLHHPGIVTLYDSITTKDQAWLVFEYVPGISLAAYIQEKGGLPAAEAVDLSIQMCEALEYAHSQGVWHLDIKPSNVLVNQGRVKITDFGIGLKSGSNTVNQGWGTPGYAPDEQLAGHPTAQSDVYAIAAVLWAMLTGEVRDGAFSTKERKLWRKVPHYLRVPLRAALARRSSERPRSPGELASSLRRAQENSNGQAGSQKVWNTVLAALLIISNVALLVGDYPVSVANRHRVYWLGTLLFGLGVVRPALAASLSLLLLSWAVFWRVPTLGVMLLLVWPLTTALLWRRFRAIILVMLGPVLSAIGLGGLIPVAAGGLVQGATTVWVAAGTSLFASSITGLLQTPLVQSYLEASAHALPQATLFQQVLAVITQISPNDMVLTLFPAMLQSAIAPPALWLALTRVGLALSIGWGKERLAWPIASGVIVAIVLVEAGIHTALGGAFQVKSLFYTLLIAVILSEAIPGRIERNLVVLSAWVQRQLARVFGKKKAGQ